LSLPIPTADHELLQVLTKNADQVLRERAEDGNDFLDVIAERVVDQLSSGRLTVKKIASDLGTSKRTISKRLADHGTSFDQLIDDIRKDLAMRYLDEGSVKVKELGFSLGFSTEASFSAAFKSWTGKTPGETRALS
jgi:AraC-like DNA-binding protein